MNLSNVISSLFDHQWYSERVKLISCLLFGGGLVVVGLRHVPFEDLYGMWIIRRKLWNFLFCRGSEHRVEKYYDYLGDDICDEFYYNQKTARHSNLENKKDLWLNCGYWKKAKNYSDACADMARLVAKEGNLNSESIVLDVGCGFAAQDILWVTEYNCKITAIDLTPLHVDVAVKRIKYLNLEDKIKVYLGNAIKLSSLFPPASLSSPFTHIIALECAFHFNTRDLFFKEAYNLLPPNGILILTDLIPKSQRPINSIIQKLGRWYTGIPNENMYDRKEYERKLKLNGFKKVIIEDISRFVFPGFTYHGTNKDDFNGVIPREYYVDMADGWYYHTGVEEYVLVVAIK